MSRIDDFLETSPSMQLADDASETRRKCTTARRPNTQFGNQTHACDQSADRVALLMNQTNGPGESCHRNGLNPSLACQDHDREEECSGHDRESIPGVHRVVKLRYSEFKEVAC